jgi:hypothetical protein
MWRHLCRKLEEHKLSDKGINNVFFFLFNLRFGAPFVYCFVCLNDFNSVGLSHYFMFLM